MAVENRAKGKWVTQEMRQPPKSHLREDWRPNDVSGYAVHEKRSEFDPGAEKHFAGAKTLSNFAAFSARDPESTSSCPDMKQKSKLNKTRYRHGVLRTPTHRTKTKTSDGWGTVSSRVGRERRWEIKKKQSSNWAEAWTILLPGSWFQPAFAIATALCGVTKGELARGSFLWRIAAALLPTTKSWRKVQTFVSLRKPALCAAFASLRPVVSSFVGRGSDDRAGEEFTSTSTSRFTSPETNGEEQMGQTVSHLTVVLARAEFACDVQREIATARTTAASALVESSRRRE